MSDAIDFVGLCIAVMSIVAGAVVLAATRRRQVAITVLLDLLTAAGLLHLAAGPTYRRAATAAIVLVLRRISVWSLDRSDVFVRAEPPRMSRPPSGPAGADGFRSP